MKFQGKEIHDVCNFLRELREDNFVSRSALAKKSGVSLNMLFHIDKGITKSPSVSTVESILSTLGYEMVIVKKEKKGK